MTNKPNFGLFSNIMYALHGMRDVLLSEKSFKIQVTLITLITILLILFSPLEPWRTSLLIISMYPILIVEAINSAIERVVDLVTQEHHELARQAKDIGAFAVLLTFAFTVIVWGVVIFTV